MLLWDLPTTLLIRSHLLLLLIILGMMLLWDLPTTLLIRSLYSRLMVAHHLALAVIAAVVLLRHLARPLRRLLNEHLW